MPTLLLHIDAAAIAGIVLDARGTPQGAASADAGWLREQAARAEQIVVLVPGEAVTLIEVPRIARQRQRFLQALPFAVEEQLAQPIEDMHIVAPARLDGERVPVACVAHADMRDWLQRLQQLDIRPDHMLPDTLALPLQGHSAVSARVGARVLVRAGTDAGFALEADALPMLGDTLGAVQEVMSVATGAELLARLGPHLSAASTLDLLQDPYRPRRRASAAGPWRAVAALVLAALLLGVAYQWLDYRALRASHAEMQQEAQRLYRQAVPGEGTVPDPVRMLRAESARGATGPGEGGLSLLARVAPLLAGGTTSVRMDVIEYRGGSLELSITTPDVPTLDGLRERLDGLPGLRVELTGASPGDAGVQGRLRIQEISP
jgi:general secretion pathway protein L